MDTPLKIEKNLQEENAELRMQLLEATETLQAISNGDIDAIIVNEGLGKKVFSLTSAETPYRIIVEEMSEGAVIISDDGLIMYHNKRFAEMVATADENLSGSGFLHFFSEKEVPKYHAILKEGINHKFNEEIECKTGDNNLVYFSLSISPLPKTMLGQICIIVMDITGQKQKEAKINDLNTNLETKVMERTKQYEIANGELEAFTYTLAHDLRAPLRAILGFSDILEADFGEKMGTEAIRLLGIIKKNTIKMGHLMEDLLGFSRIGKQSITKVSININEMVSEVIAESVKDIQKQPQWKIASLPAVKASENAIRQVWVNIIGNAIKYSGKNEVPIIEIGSFKKDAEIVFFVKDNGVGFDEKYEDKLFKVFQRLHNSSEFAGSGVGLAIVEKIISKHGGKVWAESKIGEGACFYFSLPI